MNLLHPVINVVRRYPLISRLLLGCVPDVHWHIYIRQIGKLRIRLRRNRSLWLRSPLTHEWYPLAALKAFVKPADTVWDVGANIGLYARWLTTHLNAKQVCSFEPMSENLPELEYNVKLGGVADRVMILPWALSNTDGEVDFQVDDIQSASGAVNSVYAGAACRARSALGLPPKIEKVMSRSVDSLLRDGTLPVPDVIKLDIEGAEGLFLEGAKTFFSQHSPKILIETHGLEVSKQCLAFLFDHGFAVAACVPETWQPHRHMRLERAVLSRMSDPYDTHFIIAAKNAADIPDTLDYANL
jgi:FkbM family methyltransferase